VQKSTHVAEISTKVTGVIFYIYFVFLIMH